jgi:hypothetical protein
MRVEVHKVSKFCGAILGMLVKDEHLVCTNHNCGAEFVVGRKPAIEKQNVRCCCGSELKKPYQAPVLEVYGSVITHIPAKC